MGLETIAIVSAMALTAGATVHSARQARKGAQQTAAAMRESAPRPQAAAAPAAPAEQVSSAQRDASVVNPFQNRSRRGRQSRILGSRAAFSSTGGETRQTLGAGL